MGKTSVTAASAVQWALNGEKGLVLTIDPALRLRTALGMTGDALEQRVPLDSAPAHGELWAALLDVPSTMDRMVRAHAGTAEAQKIVEHPVYKLLITSLAGMNELVAVERIDQAIAAGFENIFIDTAPSRHVFEFLDKAEFFAQLVSFPLVKLVGRTYRWWHKTSFAVARAGSLDLYRRLQQMFGAAQLSQVLDFFAIFQPVAEGYARRARQTLRMLRDPRQTAFTIVTTAASAHRDSSYLFRELTKRDYFVEQLVLNRLWPDLRLRLSPGALPGARDLARWYETVRGSHSAIRNKVHADLNAKGLRVIDVPELSSDIDGIAALKQIAGKLAG